jgi:regulator of sigma E protease
MKPGDILLEVDGEPVASGDGYRIEMVRKPRGQMVPVKVLRDGKVVELRVEQRGSESHRTFPRSTTLALVASGSALEKAGARENDEVLAVNGRPVYSGQQMLEMLRDLGGQEAVLTLRRRPEETYQGEGFEAKLVLPVRPTRRFKQEWHLYEPVIGEVGKAEPATGKLEKGDRIVRIDGAEIRSWQDLKDAIEPAIGKEIRIEFDRGGKANTVTLRPAYNDTGKGKIGIGPLPTKTFAAVPEGSQFHGRIQAGDQLLSVEGLVGEVSIQNVLGYAFKDGKASVHVEVSRAGQTVPLDLEAGVQPDCDFAVLGIEGKGGKPYLDFSRIYRKRSFGESVKDGVYEPWNIGVLTFQLLYKLFAAEESPRGLAGPVGIFDVSYRSASLGSGNLLWLLALITVNLGIFNLLPIPVLDGGHVVLLAVEKLRGKPPSEKFIAIFQYAGLVFLLALIVFVTYNDITRIFGG